jgi:hypothetical protein
LGFGHTIKKLYPANGVYPSHQTPKAHAFKQPLLASVRRMELSYYGTKDNRIERSCWPLNDIGSNVRPIEEYLKALLKRNAGHSLAKASHPPEPRSGIIALNLPLISREKVCQYVPDSRFLAFGDGPPFSRVV